MIRGFLILLLCQLAGEVVSRGLALPVPGPVLGLALLVFLLWLRDWAGMAETAGADVERVSNGLLGVLALLFVPAGVGVVQYGAVLKAHAVALAVALVVSTVVTMLATVGVFLLVKRWLGAVEPT